MVELRMAPIFREAANIMGEGLSRRARALLELALDFASWRNLARTYSVDACAALMSDAVSQVAVNR
jgi:hypothetical protein